jgi:DNA-3-methyladenine glycosylase
VEILRQRRNQPDAILTDGPAKLAQALGIDKSLNGADLCARTAALWLEAAPAVPNARVRRGPRIGLGQTPEPWLSREWNFKWTENDRR